MKTQSWVAVIDDDASVRRSLRCVLNAHDVRVETYGSAEEYLQRATAEPPQCVVIDVQLGDGMTGLELVGRLASADRPAIILMTGLEIPDAVLRNPGARTSWLRKPFDAARLIALLSVHLQHPSQPTMAPTPMEQPPESAPSMDDC